MLRKEAYTDYLLSENQIKVNREKLNAAQAALKSLEKRFGLGMATTYELLAEQNNVLTAQIELVQSQYDDEPPVLNLICDYIERTPFLKLVDCSNSALEIMERLDRQQVDLIFLDIEMPDLLGINFSKIIKQGPKIISTTAYDEYAIEGYKVEALDYLLKPISYDEFLEAAQKGREYIQLLRAASEKKKAGRCYIFVRSEYKLVKMEFDDILFIEGLKDYVKFHLESSAKPLLSLMSMKTLEAELPEHSFMRVHRSYIVNLDKIESIERRIIRFSRGEARLSEQYSEEFLERINTTQ